MQSVPDRSKWTRQLGWARKRYRFCTERRRLFKHRYIDLHVKWIDVWAHRGILSRQNSGVFTEVQVQQRIGVVVAGTQCLGQGHNAYGVVGKEEGEGVHYCYEQTANTFQSRNHLKIIQRATSRQTPNPVAEREHGSSAAPYNSRDLLSSYGRLILNRLLEEACQAFSFSLFSKDSHESWNKGEKKTFPQRRSLHITDIGPVRDLIKIIIQPTKME